MSKSETSDFTVRFRTQPNYGEYQCDNSEIKQLLDNRRFIQLQLKLPQAVKKKLSANCNENISNENYDSCFERPVNSKITGGPFRS